MKVVRVSPVPPRLPAWPRRSETRRRMRKEGQGLVLLQRAAPSMGVDPAVSATTSRAGTKIEGSRLRAAEMDRKHCEQSCGGDAGLPAVPSKETR
jgi:hypothetical protein